MFNRVVIHLKILIGIASGPGLLLILPFLLSKNDYGRIFGFIVVVQFVSLFSSLGLEVVVSRANLPIRFAFVTLAITTFLATFFYVHARSVQTSSYTAILVFGTAFTNNISLVIQNRYLFSGNTDRYARFGIYRAALMIITIFVCIRARIDIETGWAIASATSTLVPHLILRVHEMTLKNSASEKLTFTAIRSIFLASLPMAMLNSLSGLPFLAERLIARDSFSPEMFSKYAICATLMTPMVYIGNMTQNYMISHNEKIGGRTAKDAAKQLMMLCGGYVVFILSFGSFIFPSYFHGLSDFYSVLIPGVLWVYLYCITAFPLAAITQKQAGASTLSKCALVSITAIAVLYCCYWWLFKQGVRLELPWKAAIASALASIVIILIRGVFIWPLTRLGGVK